MQPLDQQREVDTAFLYDIFSFGWYNRLVSALAMYDQIVRIKDFSAAYDLLVQPNRAQKILRAKLFAEYVALLESFGGLCISLRERHNSSIRETFINVQPFQVAEFYNNILQSKKDSIAKHLKFPPPEKLKDAAHANELKEIDLVYIKSSYRNLGLKIKEIAKQYTAKKSLLVRNYNKVKHCFPVVEGTNWLMPPIPEEHVAIYSIESIGYVTMSQKDAVKEIENIRTITIIGSELLAMCKCLSDSGLLFYDR
jgi:hypothetical protein